MADSAKRAFVCGHPVAHSRSPLIHGHWLKELDIPGAYVALDVAPSEFEAFFCGMRASGYVGGNVTIPHKEAAFRLADRIDDAGKIIGAINTVWLENGTIRGTNTDWSGFAANLDDNAPEWTDGKTAVVLGAGGSARAILHALITRGYRDIRLINRTVERARELADRFGETVTAHGWEECAKLLADADLLVNTTSLGMNGTAGGEIDLAPLPQRAIVTDIVYIPLQTPLLATAATYGLTAVDGLGMLLHQAVEGFERWFGTRPEVTAELRSRVIENMERRA